MVLKTHAPLPANRSRSGQNSLAPKAYVPPASAKVGAPPVYRPGIATPAQAKALPKVGPPAVYRPGSGATAQPKMALPGAQALRAGAPPVYRPGFPLSVQRAEAGGRSSSNVNTYSSLAQSYTPEQIAEAQQEALGTNVHGHRSGNGTSGISQQTKTEMAKVVTVLRDNKAKVKAAKKKPVIKEKAPMSNFAKAMQKALGMKESGEGLGDFMDYLDGKDFEFQQDEFNQLCKVFT